MTLVLPDRFQPFYNDTDEKIPPWGLVRVRSLTTLRGRQMLLGELPDMFGGRYEYAVNGPSTVLPKTIGSCVFDDMPTPLAIDPLLYATAIDESWDYVGPLKDKTKAHRGSGGFRVLGVLQTQKFVLATREPLLHVNATLESQLTSDDNSVRATIYEDVEGEYEDLNWINVKLRLGAATLGAGTNIEAAWDRGYYWVTAAEC